MHSSHSSDRRANEDHVLQRAEVAGAGRVPMREEFTSLCGESEMDAETHL